MKKQIVPLLAGAMLMMATSAMALTLPGDTYGTWTNLQGFLGTSLFPGQETSITSLDFSGKWNYTAIAAESGNYNIIQEPANNNAGGGSFSQSGNLTGDVTFTTKNATNWGLWNLNDFNQNNLFFEDSNGPFNVKLDPFTATSTPGFKIYQLTADSSLLNYLPNKISLTKGTYIIGFNDNSSGTGDLDYDDIIIAMTTAPVPEPGTMMLLGIGMLGLVVFGKRRMNKEV